MAKFDLMDWLQETIFETIFVLVAGMAIGYAGTALDLSWLINPIADIMANPAGVGLGLFATLGLANFLQEKLKFK